MMKCSRLLVAVAALAATLAAGAETITITLNDAIARARVQSVNAAVALNELRTAYWEFRTYKAELLPEINFNSKIPGYYKRYSTYQESDGSYSFVRNNYLQMTGELSVDQKIWATGGTLSLNTSLDFMRQLDGVKQNRFMSIPVALTLSQPIFGVNTVKWDRRIEPVRYAESKAAFLTATEEVAMTAVQHFFNLLMARESLAIARQNLDNATRLYEVAKVKREMGQISQNDLLQMELNLLDARSELTDCESTLKSDMFRLRSFLDIDEDTEIVPVVPSSVPVAEISYADALDRALTNNKFAKNIRRRQLEADYEVAKAKGSLRQISLFAQIGYTGTAGEAADSYRNLRGNQLVEVGISVPLLDWGKRRGRVKVAESNRRVTESRLRQERADFNQDLFVLVERFCNQQSQLAIAARSNEIARKRYDTNVQTYMIGKISTLDLNDSQSKKDEAMRQYVNELYKFWNYWYQIRSLTLYDYEHRDNITADIERLVKN